MFTPNEARYCAKIRQKNSSLRNVLNTNTLSDPIDPRQWIGLLTYIKHTLGNLSNDISFVASLLVKRYLIRRFGPIKFDSAGKPQGASGIDIKLVTDDGTTIAGELKTTIPYLPGFGAQQLSTIKKDLARLAVIKANHRFMFVIDPGTFKELCKKNLSSKAPGVEIVDLLTKGVFVCPSP